jgi:hypothetical protein
VVLAEPPTGARRALMPAVVAAAVALAAAGFTVGRAGGGPHDVAAPLTTIGRVPVGVVRSSAGALAAADSYLLVDQATIEQNPGRFGRLVGAVFAPSLRHQVLAQAATVRATDPSGMTLWAAAGRSVTLIGAHRLDRYGHGTAEVTDWIGTVFWGPDQPPKQAWSLARVKLRWSRERWLITGIATRLASPGPVPALTPQANPSDDTSGAFDNTLAGFTAISTGAPSR